MIPSESIIHSNISVHVYCATGLSKYFPSNIYISLYGTLVHLSVSCI